MELTDEKNYDYVVNRIKEIENQCDMLKDADISSCYNIPFSYVEMFSALKLSLIRDRSVNLEMIENEKKKFLVGCHVFNEEYQVLENEVNDILDYLYKCSYTSGNDKLQKIVDEKIKLFFFKIRSIIDTLAADDLMLKEIEELEIEYNNLINSKVKLEKENNREKKKKKLLDFHIF